MKKMPKVLAAVLALLLFTPHLPAQFFNNAYVIDQTGFYTNYQFVSPIVEANGEIAHIGEHSNGLNYWLYNTLLNANGQFLTHHFYRDSPNNLSLSGWSTCLSQDGNHMVVIGAHDRPTGSTTMMVAKIHISTGTVVWANRYPAVYGVDIEYIGSGNYAYVGVYQHEEIVMGVIDDNGTGIWHTGFNGLPAGQRLTSTSLTYSAQNNTIAVTGFYDDPPTVSCGIDNRVFVFAVDPTGSIVQNLRTFNYTCNNQGAHINATSDGGYVLTFATPTPAGSPGAGVLKLNASFSQVWSNVYTRTDGFDQNYPVAVQELNGFYDVAVTSQMTGSPGLQAAIFRMNTSGTIQPGSRMYDVNNSATTALGAYQRTTFLEPDASGGYLLSGMRDVVPAGPLVNQSGFHLIRTDPNLVAECSETIPVSGSTITPVVNNYTLTDNQLLMQMAFTPDDTRVEAAQFECKDNNRLAVVGEHDDAIQQVSDFQVFPNPTVDNLTVQYELPEGFQTGQLTIYSRLGSVVHSEIISKQGGQALIDLKAWDSGLYFIQLSAGGQVIGREKVVVTP